MKSLDWKKILKEHPVFSALTKKEIDWLAKVSLEKECEQGDTIIRVGERGDSVYVIGAGAVDVVLPWKDSENIHLTTLRKDELFGEMAVFEGQPRSATVIAREGCLLLEIKGQDFLRLVNERPEIELKVTANLSARLRRLGEQIIKLQRDLHERVEFLNTKVDAELKTTDVTLRATQTMFDQTNARAKEIIDSADRARGRLMWHVTFIGSAIAVTLSFLGFLGIKQVGHIQASIEETKRSVQESVDGIEKDRKKVQTLYDQTKQASDRIQGEAEDAEKNAKEIRQASAMLRTINRDVETFQKFYREQLATRFQAEMANAGEGSLEAALELYGKILETDDEMISDEVFKFINRKIGTRARFWLRENFGEIS